MHMRRHEHEHKTLKRGAGDEIMDDEGARGAFFKIEIGYGYGSGGEILEIDRY